MRIRIGHGHINLGDRIEELRGEEEGYRGLYARTQYEGWWRVRFWRGRSLAYRVRRLKRR